MTRNELSYDLFGRVLNGLPFQVVVDSLLSQKYNKLDTPNFNWDIPQVDFTFEQLQAENNIYAMATYVDLNSELPPRSVEGIALTSAKIPHLGHKYDITSNILREKMLLLSKGVFDKSSEEAILSLLYNNLDQLIGGIENSLTYQRHQAVSTGKLVISSTNNPQGIQSFTIDFKVPTANKTTLGGNYRWWTTNYETQGSSSAPVTDLINLIKAAENDSSSASILETSMAMFKRFLGHTAVQKELGYLYNPEAASDTVASNIGKRLSIDEARSLLERKLGTTIRIIDSISIVESYSKTDRKIVYTRLPSFEQDSWALVPDGNLGTIKNAVPIVFDEPSVRNATYHGGRTHIMQSFNPRTKVQSIEAMLHAVCVPNNVRNTYILKVR